MDLVLHPKLKVKTIGHVCQSAHKLIKTVGRHFTKETRISGVFAMLPQVSSQKLSNL